MAEFEDFKDRVGLFYSQPIEFWLIVTLAWVSIGVPAFHLSLKIKSTQSITSLIF